LLNYGGASLDLRAEEEERCHVDPTAYTGAAVMAWTRRWWSRSGRRRHGPSRGGAVQRGPDGIHRCGVNDVDPMAEEEEQCGVDPTAYTDVVVTAWTQWSGRRRRGPSGDGRDRRGAGVDSTV
jgi:hypothetical protein